MPRSSSPRHLPPTALRELVAGLPKTVLHLHIEGSLEPELAFELAERNGIELGSKGFPYSTLEQLRAAYRFADLGAFLDVYYAVAGVLRTEQDFCDLARAYASRLRADAVRWAEVFFDPQTHTSRGIPFAAVVRGLVRGFAEARDEGIHVALIACILRDAPVGTPADLDEADPEEGFASMERATAWATLGQLLRYHQTQTADDDARTMLMGLGLDSYEKPYPPELFTEVYRHARAAGLRTTAHAGEEGPPAYVWTALRELGVSRIDHGVRSTDDPALMAFLAEPHDDPEIVAAYGEPHRIPLTVCPRSNYMLKVFPDPRQSNLLTLLDRGVLASIHSDDPAYFGGYASANYQAVIEWLDPSWTQLRQLARNGVESAWAGPADKAPLLEEIDRYLAPYLDDAG
ncbi:MAG: adenosine deaminase family protein [Myxococcales bacterium]|nr:adenosine deaminase family protein [Myxococcales bacterium]